jgi:hypothetical protein
MSILQDGVVDHFVLEIVVGIFVDKKDEEIGVVQQYDQNDEDNILVDSCMAKLYGALLRVGIVQLEYNLEHV